MSDKNIKVRLRSARHSYYASPDNEKRTILTEGAVFLVSEHDLIGLKNRVEIVLDQEGDLTAIREARERAEAAEAIAANAAEAAEAEIAQANARADRAEVARLAAEEAQLQAEIAREG